MLLVIEGNLSSPFEGDKDDECIKPHAPAPDEEEVAWSAAQAS